MIAHGVTLLIIALLEAILGLYIFDRDRKNAVNISFLLLTIGVVIWVGVNSYLAMQENMQPTIWYKLAYFSGTVIASSFLYFAWVFPYRISQTGKISKVITIVPVVIFMGLILLTDAIVKSVMIKDNIANVTFGDGFILYLVFFFGYFIWAIATLGKKYARSNGIHYWQLRYVIIGALIPFLINLIFDMLLPWLGYTRQPWMVYIGAELSIVWLGLTGWVALKKKITKNI